MKRGLANSNVSDRRCGRFLAGLAGAVLTLGTLMAQEPFRITRVEPVADRLGLSWEGDPALDYFEVQTWNGQGSESWEPAVLTAHRSVELERQGLQGFLRIAAISRPGPVTPISDVRRHEILAEVAVQVAALPGEDAEADAVAVAAILRSHPEIEVVGISAGAAVSARFRDGRRLLIINDRPPADPSEFENGVDNAFFNGGDVAGRVRVPIEDGGVNGAGLEPAGGRSPRSVRGTTGLPVSRRATLFQAKGMGIDSPMLSVLVPAFQQAGYQVHGQEASLANFLAVSDFGDDIGVFYVDAHGGILLDRVPRQEVITGNIVFDHSELFVIATSTVATPGTEALYGDTLFANGEIGYVQLGPSILKGIRRNLPGPDPKPAIVSSSYYLIAPEFVRKRWRFSRNSLVVFDTCHSAGGGAASFREICYAAGAALYAGWTDSVHDAWAFKRTTPPLFELLLGGSHIYHTEPPQRPFNIDAVLDYLDTMGLRVDKTPKFPGARFTCFGGPGANGSFQILNPSIFTMRVTESLDELNVFGYFDPEAPTIARVKGDATAEIPAQTVTRTELTFPLPADSSPSVGDVTIVQRGRDSNTIPLSEWTIDATLVKHYSVGITSPSATSELKLRFRGDAHEARLRPFTDPVFLGVGGSIARGTTGRAVSASGIYHYPGNQGSLEWSLDSPVDVPFADLRGTLGISQDRSGTLTCGIVAGNVMTVTATNADGVVVVGRTEPGTRVFPPGETTIDPSTFRINAGSGSAASDSGTFEWKNADPRFPPTGNFAR